MNIVKSKSVLIFSNGSLVFCLDTLTNLKQYQISEKDYKNFFLFKKHKTLEYKKSNLLLKYKNRYLY